VRMAVRRVVLLAGGVAASVGCQLRRETAAIAIETAGELGPLAVIQAVLDSTSRSGGYPVRLVMPGELDVGSQEPYLIQAVRRAMKLGRRADVVGVVGPAGSSDALLVAPVYHGVGIPRVIPTANAPQLDKLNGEQFLMAPTMDQEVRFMADYARDRLGARTAIVLYTPGAWGSAIQAGLATELWQRGVQVLQRVPVPLLHCSTADPLVRRLLPWVTQAGRPDVVMLATYDPCLIGQIERVVPGLSYIAGDGMLLQQASADDLGGAAERVHAVAFYDPAEASPAAAGFRRRFTDLVGRPPTWADAATYDATMVLVAAVRAVGPDRTAVTRYLHELGRERPPYRGLTGLIDFRGTRSGRLIMESASVRAAPADAGEPARP
jgi:branched-chain amino acid transport system substrate-binding protein